MSAYGDFLSTFPELFRTVMFWDREPQLGSGYIHDKSKEIPMRCIVLTTRQSSFQPMKAAEYKALDIENHDVLYCRSNIPIMEGMFLRHPDSGDIYTVDVTLDYSFTGGFKAFGIDKVQGANGLNQKDITIKEGVF